ncbi:hypothetical protein V8G69_07580 [Gaetbulibacter sp. M235]|uniref:hypothetical protein n=1 Tax=Gaetbulibacter sp. M235 TaxID=3126510 RepID=UPI00374F4EBF
MDGVYKYSIIKPLELIIQFHQNDLTFDGIKALKQSIIRDSNYNPKFNFIIDLRLANIKMSLLELKLYGDWVEETLNDSHKNMALFTDNPSQVSNAMLFKLNDNIKNLYYEVVSSMEGVLSHVDVDISNLELVENEISKLKVKE